MKNMTEKIQMITRVNFNRMGALVIIAGCLIAPLSQAALLSDDFSDNERSTQNLPTSAAWYSSSTSDQLSAATGDLVSVAGRHSLAYFTDSGSPHQLANVGDSLTVSFTLSMKNPLAGYSKMYIGLFNSEGTRIAADTQGLVNAAFGSNRYLGYAAILNLDQGSAMKFGDRNQNSSNLLNTGAAYETHGSFGSGETFISDQDYAATMILTRTASGVKVSFSFDDISGYAGSWEDTTDAVYDFDTFAIYGFANGMDEYTIKEISITAIPEPTTLSLLGVSALVVVAVRKLKMG